MSKIKIGIIGGTGLDNPDLLKNAVLKPINTPFGQPSDGAVLEGEIDNIPCVILSRHGKCHNVPPSKINFRANISALKIVGCTHIVATTAMGSLKEEYKPGDLVILNDFIDRTKNRRHTFYDGEEDSIEGIFHLPTHPPFSEPLRKVIIDTAKEIEIDCHDAGTVVTIEGPRFSSKAESTMFQMLGCDSVNMTTVPEVTLAKEAGLLYAAIGVITDYDCWKEDHVAVSHEFVQETFKANVDKLQKFLIAVIHNISKVNWSKDISDLKELVANSFMHKP